MDMPLLFEGSDLKLYLLIGFKYPSFNSSGYIPDCTTALTISYMQGNNKVSPDLTSHWIYNLIQKSYHFKARRHLDTSSL